MTWMGNAGKEWVLDDPPEWSPFGGRVWAYSDPDRGLGLMASCTGKVMEISVEVVTEGADMHVTLPLSKDATASFLEFVKEQLTANGVRRPQQDK